MAHPALHLIRWSRQLFVLRSRVGAIHGFGRIAVVLAIVGAVTGGFFANTASGNGPVAEGTLVVRGARLTVYSDADTDDSQQVVNVGERARVRTCYGMLDAPCGEVPPGDPRIAGLEVLAELRGPELPQAIPLSTVPGGTFLLPGFSREGDYLLENIRLLNSLTGEVLGTAEPSIAVIHVRQIVLARAEVTTLSLEDLEARGIAITQENFQAFDFTVGFLIEGSVVNIDLPVLYEGGGEVSILEKPTVRLDELPGEVADVVRRWQPPTIVPFTLELPEVETLDAGEEPYAPITFPIFGAVVMPGNVSFLNQFFEATLIVANGAPPGFGAVLDNLSASLRLPDGNVLRVAETEPPVAPGQKVPMVAVDGSHSIGEGEQASAGWTVEGLVAGTHALQMDVEGELLRPGRPTVPVTTHAQAAVEVVDARFHLVFSHPDVVREGTAYSLYVTVANQSRATQNLISVQIRDERITGAHKEDPGDDFTREIESLAPGQSETLEFRLVADQTGQVVGGTFESTSTNGSGAIQLYTGVGELGIPLSPATLRLPRFTERLATPYVATDDYMRSVSRFLGLAYSLAVAPAALTPPGLPKVIRSDVETRAVDLGFAGQRTFLGEELLETLEVLLLDQLGNSEPLAEIDALRRASDKGLATGVELARLLRIEQEARGLDAVEFLDHFAETTSYADPYLAAMMLPAFTTETPDLEIRQLTGDGWPTLARPGDEPVPLRTMEFGDVFAVNELSTGGDQVPFAVVGSVSEGEHHDIYLRNSGGEDAAGRLILLVSDGAGYRRVDFGAVTVPPHTAYRVTTGTDIIDDAFEVIEIASGETVSGVFVRVDPVVLPPFRMIGARQDFGIGRKGTNWPNRYGRGVSYLFNRPPDLVAAEDAAAYRIRSIFTDGEGESFESLKQGVQAFVQPSRRVVNVRFSSPVSALWDATSAGPLVEHVHLIDSEDFVDAEGESLDPAIPDPRIEYPPQHTGGLLGGRVLRGTGAPAANSTVQLIRPREIDTPRGLELKLDLVGEMITGNDGWFYFDFVEHPHPDLDVRDEFILRAIVPEGEDPATEPAAEEEVRSTIRLQNRLTLINIALLGRGTVTGRLVYLDNGDPVAGGTVTVASTLFNDSGTVTVGEDGSFQVPAMPVGPLTLTGRDPEGRVVYATVGLERPGDLVHVVLELPRTQPPGMGTVVGTVLRQASGAEVPAPSPVAGATVEVTAQGASLGKVETDSFGHFRVGRVPAGQVTVQAADWRVSRTSVLTDLLLAADQVAEITLTLPDEPTRSVSGRVLFYDAANNAYLPVAEAAVFIPGPGVFAYSGADGSYRIDGVPAQAAGAGTYSVRAIDYERKLEGNVQIPVITSESPEVILAQDIVLREMRGGIDGVVLDPLGRPFGGAQIIATRLGVPYTAVTSKFDGSFSFGDLALGEWELTAHFGDGLQPGRVGYFGASAKTKVIFGGHRPFASIRMVGSGVVELQVSSSKPGSVWAEVYYKPTYYSDAAKAITRKGVAIETQTGENGFLELMLPVGGFEITVYSPFHGVRTVTGQIEWPGQLKNIDVVFDGSSSVSGQLVNVDGVTPIPDFDVYLHTEKLLPQKQRTDPEGRFDFDLVPQGRLEVRAEGVVGTVERVGIATGFIGGGSQNLELQVRMKAQGTVEGQVFERVGDQLVPLASAQVYLQEYSYPLRRLPYSQGWYGTDSEGRYQIPHVYAGKVRVVARDSLQVSRQGGVDSGVSRDWQVVTAPDLVLTTDVGSVAVTVRDPQTGAVLPDTQVKIRSGDFENLTVADASGVARFDALPLWTYWVTAFHAPTGRSGQIYGVKISTAGQHVDRTLYVDQRGSVGGFVFDDIAKLLPVQGATVRLSGSTAGGGLSALDTTSGQPESLGRYEFSGIPEGDFHLTAVAPDSPRRGAAQVSLTDTAPIAEIDLIFEPVGDVYFRIFENLSTGLEEIDPAVNLLSVRLQQVDFDFTYLQPPYPAPGHLYAFSNVLLDRTGTLSVQELGGELRRGGVGVSNFVNGVPRAGSGSEGDPYQIVLGPKGTVRVQVLDADSLPVAGANVTLRSTGGGAEFPSVTGEDGFVSFASVPAGNLDISASAPLLGVGGRSTAELVFDDDVIDVEVRLSAAVSLHGVVYQPVPGDVYNGDPSTLVPQADALVVFGYSGRQLVMTTGADGLYRFDALPEGASYSVAATSANGQSVASTSGVLLGPNGNDNEAQPLILDGGPPEIISIVPPPGMEDVSRTAEVVITFSEPLLIAVVPTGQHTSPYFEVRGPNGVAAGAWTSFIDPEGRQAVRFEPSEPYENQTIYSLRISGGPNGVRDRAGRPITEIGDVGSNFKTSDSIGPAVVGSVPSLDRPVEPGKPVRFDFNEGLIATDEQLDGDGSEDAAVLSWGQSDGSGGVVWQVLPISLYMTRSNYSMTVVPVEGLELTDDSLLRRIEIGGLEDTHGNRMEAWEREYRVWDDNPPVIDELPPPPTAPDGRLVPGNAYTVTPVLSGIDNYPLDPPDGDLDSVAYYFEDPADPESSAQPGFVATASPYEYSFVAGYSGNGIDPRPFPIWAQAVDTSTNASDVVLLEMVVLPNQAPTIGAVGVEAVSPVAGVFYAGSSIRSTIDGLADADGTQLSLNVHLWHEGLGVLDAAPTLTLTRPASGDWSELAPPTVEFELPMDLAEGAELYVRATATDSAGAIVEVESSRFAVADDQTGPVLEDIAAHSAPDGVEAVSFVIGDRLWVEFAARDVETEVVEATVSFDRTDIFPMTLVANRVSGDLFRTDTVTVPFDVFTDATPVEVTVSAQDRGGNTSTAVLAIEVAPDADPTAPTVEWSTPWEGGAWPADYTSQVSPGTGVAMLVRVHAQDLSIDENDNTVPGSIVGVLVRGPVSDGAGGFVLSETSIAATPIGGAEPEGEDLYQALWAIPDQVPTGQELPFEVRVVDSGGNDVVDTVNLTAVASRKVYEGVLTAVSPADEMLDPEGDENGTVFLLGGSTLSVYPRSDGNSRTLDGLYLYSGAEVVAGETAVRPTVLTVPQITSYSSSVLFNPLELEIAEVVGIGAGARIDVSDRGLLGSTAEDNMALAGETPAERDAGGSHGGSGWFGSSSSYWDSSTLYHPSSSYGSVRNPRHPGAGGGGSSSYAGGAGGGVVRLDVSEGLVHLAGSIHADGGDSSHGAGAGGSVWLAAAELDGNGLIAANGGSSESYRGGGGGGGRISVLYRELGALVDLLAQIDASGGVNKNEEAQRAGAGTVYLEQLDPVSGASSGIGRLTVSNGVEVTVAPTLMPALGDATVVAVDPGAGTVTVAADRSRGSVTGDSLVVEDSESAVVGLFEITGQRSAAGEVELEVAATSSELSDLQTLLGGGDLSAHARARYAEVSARGAVRLAFDDDLVVGPEGDPSPALNDPGALNLEAGSRAILRGQGPEVFLAATPDPGGSVPVGSTIEISWSIDDPVGVWEWSEDWPVSAYSRWERRLDQPEAVAVSPDPLVLTIPAETEDGPVSLSFETTDIAGRTTTRELTWTVMSNQVPTGSLAFADGAPTTVLAGTSTTVVVHAEDAEGLASAELAATGPAAEAIQLLPLEGSVQDVSFEVVVQPDADGSVPIVVQATITDTSGAAVLTNSLEIGVTPDLEDPSIALDLLPVETGDIYEAGDSVRIRVIPSDNVDVGFLSVSVGGEVTTTDGPSQTIYWVAPPVEEETVVEILVEAHDLAGNVATMTRALTVKPHINSQPPVVGISCPVSGDFCADGAATTVEFSITDDVKISSYSFFVDGALQGAAVPVNEDEIASSITWTPPAGTQPGEVFSLRLEARDFANNIASFEVDLTAISGTVLNGGRKLTSDHGGEDLVLTNGSFVVSETLRPASLTLLKGATIVPEHTWAATSYPPVRISSPGQVRIACGAGIDVTGRGYLDDTIYPGVELPSGNRTGGSHLGEGGVVFGTPGETFGSVYRPLENGGTTNNGWQGLNSGGVVRIEAESLVLDAGAAILANGAPAYDGDPTAAGGSVWITAGTVEGAGAIEARGGEYAKGFSYSDGSGGGGAIAIEFEVLSEEILNSIRASGGGKGRDGGAGTIYLKGPDSTFGDLLVDNDWIYGSWTILPTLGTGTTEEIDGVVRLVSNQPDDIHQFFVGHWVQVSDGDGQPRGAWRVEGVDGNQLNLEPDSIFADGDTWQGMYRFDTVTVTGRAKLRLYDLDDFGEVTVHPSSDFAPINEGGPSVSWPGAVVLEIFDRKYTIHGLAGAINDPSGVDRAEIRNTNSLETWELTLGDDGSFEPVEVTGDPNDQLVIYAVDRHPESADSTTDIYRLPENAGPPTISENLLEWSIDEERVLHLAATSGWVQNEEWPLYLTVANSATGFSTNWQMLDDSSFDVVVDAQAGDVIALTAADGHPDQGVATLDLTVPAIVLLEAMFESDTASVAETTEILEIDVVLTHEPTESVSVTYQTIAETASPDHDYVEDSGVLAFAEGETRKTIQIQILDDDRPESDESFRLELDEQQVGLYLGEPSSIDVTIISDEPDIESMTYSVGGGGNLLTSPVGVEIVDGVATFAEPLPQRIDRGDRVDIEGLGAVFIGECSSDTTCAVFGGKGYDARGVLGGTATSISRAFASLADAVSDAADAEHLDTLDLVDADLMLEFLCYGGEADTGAVVIDGWITSPESGIRITAPTTAEIRGSGQRHDGRWNDQAYRLEAYDSDCIRSSVGNVSIEGLQLHCRGFGDGITGIRLDGISGDVVVAETLIRLDGSASSDERTGIFVRAAATSEVVIRNSVLWDIGDGSSFEQTGILVDGADSTVFAANNTIVGAGYGMRNLGGSVTAINNLVLESRMDAFDGEFEPGSARNLSDDESAPGPPMNTDGPVIVRSPAPGTAADYRLGCGVLDLEIGEDVVVTHNFNPWEWERLFDGVPETLAVTPQVEEGVVTLEFSEPRWITGTGIAFSNADSHTWRVTGAMTEGDLGDPNSPSYVELVPAEDSEVNHRERSRSFVTLAAPQEIRFLRLTTTRGSGADYIHVGEWWIDGLNPACGQGVDLTDRPYHSFAVDVEGYGRINSWDIGADQSNELTVGFIGGPWMWWESEGEASVQVMLSEPAQAPVSVRYATSSGSAYEGLDFTEVQGSLTFAPGEVSKIVTVPVVDDGPGDQGEDFFLNLSDAAGARLGFDQFRLELNEGDAPPRVRFTDVLMEADEAEPIFTAGIEVVPMHPVKIEGWGDVSDHSAYFSLDYRGIGDGAPWPYFSVPGGQAQGTVELEIIADGIPEPDEGFLVKTGWFPDAESGVPSIGYVRIHDHSPLLFDFAADLVEVDEGVGSAQLEIVLSKPASGEVSVRYRSEPDSAAEGADFVAVDDVVVFSEGEIEKTIDVPILDDDVTEDPEVFRVELYEPVGGELDEGASIDIVILDDDVPNEVSFEVDVVEEFEDIGTIRIDVVLTRAEDEPVSVSYRLLPESATPGVDFLGEDGELIFAPGEVRRTIEIDVIDDAEPELEEFIFIELHDPVGVVLGDLTAVWVAIYDNEPPAVFTFLDPDFVEVFEGDVSIQFGVFLSEDPAAEVSVRYRTVPDSAEEGSDFVAADGRLVFEPGTPEQFFEIQILEDITLEDAESFTVELYDPIGVVLTQWRTCSVTILDNEPPSVLAFFAGETTQVAEGSGTAQLNVQLAAATPREATVRYRSFAKSATADLDYVEIDGELLIPAGASGGTIEIEIIEDGLTEGAEDFRVELYDPNDLVLGYPPFTDVTILDNEPEPVTVTYSVGVDSSNWIYSPLGIDIVDGTATFSEPWPPGLGRGDRLEIEGVGGVYLGQCHSDTECSVFDRLGETPADVIGGLATSATRAFFSLQDAMTGAADAEHLGTFDLVAAERSLEILCYGSWGEPDSTPVSIDGWITSPENQIRVVVPSLPPWAMVYQRHQGRWDDLPYHLAVSTGTCVTSSVGNLVLEGLQFHCAGDPAGDVHGVLLDGVDGDVRLSESLIRLDGAPGLGDRIGVEMRSAVSGDLVVRNSVFYDLGDGSSESHAGIVNSSAAATLFAANNTVSGGAYGIRSLGGEATAINNLVVDATLACFDGPFAAESTRNLASDTTAPDPPAGGGGTVTMVDPTSGPYADFHLECGILDKVTEFYDEYGLSYLEQLAPVFDGNPETLIISPGNSTARLVLVFSEPQTFTGMSVELSNCNSYEWMVEGADILDDLTPDGASYRLLVPVQVAENPERIWDEFALESPETVGVIALTVERKCDNNSVHLNEWTLTGHNPACGQATDLSKDPNHAFGGDVDSAGRAKPWDIGADQGRDATVDIYYDGPTEWWETEGAAEIEVVLSEPVDAEVKVRWEAMGGTAVEGEDFVGTRGVLTIPAGSTSGIISIPLIDDGPGDDFEDFDIVITSVSGASLEYMPAFRVVILEGDPPPRVSLASHEFVANEADGEAVVWVNLSQPLPYEVSPQWDAISRTAKIGPDFVDPFVPAVFPAGATQVPISFRLVDDGEAEPDEKFIIKASWPNGAVRGLPARGVVRIEDDDTAKRVGLASEVSAINGQPRATAGAVKIQTAETNSVDRRSLRLLFVDGAFYGIVPAVEMAFPIDPARSELVNRSTGDSAQLALAANGTFVIGNIAGSPEDTLELRLCREDARDLCETVILKEDRQ